MQLCMHWRRYQHITNITKHKQMTTLTHMHLLLRLSRRHRSSSSNSSAVCHASFIHVLCCRLQVVVRLRAEWLSLRPKSDVLHVRPQHLAGRDVVGA
jgi:hypothetical protein